MLLAEKPALMSEPLDEVVMLVLAQLGGLARRGQMSSDLGSAERVSAVRGQTGSSSRPAGLL